mmetsp:Transcript_6173/g.9971  ORF Transcript_6173/g.9971 Transcript_6173/m.9971 type:complete len:99 (+) Transcript_6173:1218-1514(+)
MWYKYDDDTVSCIGPALQQKTTQNACLLFYKRRGETASKKMAAASKKIEEENQVFAMADAYKGNPIIHDFMKDLVLPKAKVEDSKVPVLAPKSTKLSR